jgi:hypothetical protein
MQRIADQSVAANLVAWEGPLIGKNDVDTLARQNTRGRGSGGTCADDQDVATIIRMRGALLKQAGRR